MVSTKSKVKVCHGTMEEILHLTSTLKFPEGDHLISFTPSSLPLWGHRRNATESMKCELPK
jgi:hypothetical protein